MSSPIPADGNWSTLQGDPGHTGYVAASFSTANFSDAWTITTPNAPSDVAARSGSVFYNVQGSDGHIYTQAVSTSNGSSLWGFDLGNSNVYPGTHPFGPSYANGRVASMAPNNSSSAAPLQVINATTGGYVSTPTYDAQFSSGSVLTPVGDELFFASGYYGNVVFDADAATGNNLWRADLAGMYTGNVMQGESVAVDQDYVYFFKGGAVYILSRSGVLEQSIQNPLFSHNGLSYSGDYDGAPILDGAGRIFTYTDNFQIGDSLPIAAFALNNDKPLWRTGYSYTGQPAVHGNRLYAIRSSSTIVDLIDVSTGLLAGSINVGGTGNLTSNVVVTNGHLFVSSANTTFAVDLTKSNFPVVWKTSYGGDLAITPDGYLIISTATGLHAVKLK
ncbi:MAG: outer membrane protein assembly factor BamB family protein [Sphingomonas sp.]